MQKSSEFISPLEKFNFTSYDAFSFNVYGVKREGSRSIPDLRGQSQIEAALYLIEQRLKNPENFFVLFSGTNFDMGDIYKSYLEEKLKEIGLELPDNQIQNVVDPKGKPIKDTGREIFSQAEFLKREGIKNVVSVANPPHTQRVDKYWSKSGVKAFVFATNDILGENYCKYVSEDQDAEFAKKEKLKLRISRIPGGDMAMGALSGLLGDKLKRHFASDSTEQKAQNQKK